MDLDISFHLPHQSSLKTTPTHIPIEQLDLSFNQIPISNTLVEDILQHQSQEAPLPSRLTLPPKNILYRQIKDCLSEWYRYDSKKSLHANIYYWSTYRYLTRSHFRMIQHEELLRPQSLITYFYKEKSIPRVPEASDSQDRINPAGAHGAVLAASCRSDGV